MGIGQLDEIVNVLLPKSLRISSNSLSKGRVPPFFHEILSFP